MGIKLYKKYIKRILDMCISAILLIVLIIPMLLIAILVKATSPGPVLFIQERYGKNSKPFNLYKFRSMTANAPVKANSEFNNITNYVTPFGMFIRKTSLDELPQLWNIIKGNMSFIGPRPLASTDNKVVELRKVNGADQVLPGISGLAQVNGRNNVSDEEKAMFDAKYAKNISLKLDGFIIFQTFISVVKQDDIFKESIVKNGRKGDSLENDKPKS